MDKIHVLVSDIVLYTYCAAACLEYGHLGISIYMQISLARWLPTTSASDGVA